MSGAEVPQGSTGPRVSSQLTQVMAERETDMTTKILTGSVIASLAQDARDGKAPVLLKCVLWSWPRGLPGTLLSGVTSLSADTGPPWIEGDVYARARGTQGGRSGSSHLGYPKSKGVITGPKKRGHHSLENRPSRV